MDGSHRTRVGRVVSERRRRPGAHARVGAMTTPLHAAASRGGNHSADARTRPSGSHTRTRSAQARRRAAARERMLQRRRRSLGALSLLVMAVTVLITLTRPAPQHAEAAQTARTATVRDVPAAVYSGGQQSLPAGAAASALAASEFSVPADAVALTAKPVTWTQPPGATIHCPIRVTACVDLKAKITWLQHGSHIVLGPVRMQPGEGSSRTPKGLFTINKKAKVYYSHTYGGAMPYSVFWGHDGIAYHEGTLTGYSHGCIHLSMENAKRFFAALHKGERVYVA